MNDFMDSVIDIKAAGQASFMDFQKAFDDTLDQILLSKKLELYNCRGPILSMVKS